MLRLVMEGRGRGEEAFTGMNIVEVAVVESIKDWRDEREFLDRVVEGASDSIKDTAPCDWIDTSDS